MYPGLLRIWIYNTIWLHSNITVTNLHLNDSQQWHVNYVSVWEIHCRNISYVLRYLFSFYIESIFYIWLKHVTLFDAAHFSFSRKCACVPYFKGYKKSSSVSFTTTCKVYVPTNVCVCDTTNHWWWSWWPWILLQDMSSQMFLFCLIWCIIR